MWFSFNSGILCSTICNFILLNIFVVRAHHTRKENLKDGLKRASFDESGKWKSLFPYCDPEVNPNPSPINIVMKDTVHKSDYLKRLVVHSGIPPEECLFLSLIYKKDDFEMETLNIFPSPICKNQITQISGAEESVKEKLYFQRAFVLFTKTKVDPPRSLHQFDGKSFDMEIVMEFADKAKATVTNVHLMVEALPPDKASENPIFKAIEEALIKLKSNIIEEASGKTNRSITYKALKEKCDETEQDYFEAFSIHEKEAKQGKGFNERLKELERLITEIKNIRDDDVKALMKKGSANGTTLVQNQLQPLEEEREALTAKRDELMGLVGENDIKREYSKQFVQVNADIKKCTIKIEKLKRIEKKFEKVSPAKILKNVKYLLTLNKVGIPGKAKTEGVLFESPDAVYRERDGILEKLSNLHEAQMKYDKACSEFVKFQRVPYAFVPIEGLLQLSWLFPHYGGYFLYQGSSPIPMCEPRRNLIIFETPIQITTNQLKLFQELPSLHGMNKSGVTDGSVTVDKMIPILHHHPVSLRHEVLHFPESPVFLKDDGFHVSWSRENKTRSKPFGFGQARDLNTAEDINVESIGVKKYDIALWELSWYIIAYYFALQYFF